MSFTKGPWKIASDMPALAIYAPCGERIVQTTNQNNSKSFGVATRDEGVSSDANAHLIAAAPELYEAAQMAVDFYAMNSQHPSEAHDLLAKALAKARGES